MSDNFITYSVPREFFGINIPIPIQSAYLRDYASRAKLTFILPATEICFKNSFYTLSNLLRGLGRTDHFGAVSILCLPMMDETLFKSLISVVSSKNDIVFHFPLESFVGNADAVLKWRADFLLMRRYCSKFDRYGINLNKCL